MALLPCPDFYGLLSKIETFIHLIIINLCVLHGASEQLHATSQSVGNTRRGQGRTGQDRRGAEEVGGHRKLLSLCLCLCVFLWPVFLYRQRNFHSLRGGWMMAQTP